MKPVEIVSVFVRFLAVILVLSALRLVVGMVQQVSLFASLKESYVSLFLPGGIMVLLLLAIALLFWLYPAWIGGLIVPKDIDSEFQAGFTAEQLEVVLLSLLGLWVLVDAVPNLAQIGVWFATRLEDEDLIEGWQGLVLRLVQTAIGTFLVFRSAGLRRILNEIRTK